MNQQQHDMYYDYPPSANRSPGSTRQGYATVGLGSGLQGHRSAQRQPLDNLGGPLGSSALYSPDERYDGAMHRFDRLNPSSMQQQSGYMLENSQTWGYNNAGAATMNGPLNGNGRLGSRPVNRRAALPSVS